MAQSFNDGNRHLGLPSPSNKIFFCRQGSLAGAVARMPTNVAMAISLVVAHVRFIGDRPYGPVQGNG
jgi:hypothetical protein